MILDAKMSPSMAQETTLLHQQTRLRKRIQQFVGVCQRYLPGLSEYVATPPNHSEASDPSHIPLYLPSSLPKEKYTKITIPGLAHIEEQLRFAQASDALVQLRLQLTKRTLAARYRSRKVGSYSQNQNTRFRELQVQTERKIKVAQLKYTVARSAFLHLHGPGPWENSLKVLHSEDIRGLGERALRAEEREVDHRMQILAGVHGPGSASLTDMITAIIEDSEPPPPTQFTPNLALGEGTRTLSWIWYSTTGKEFNNSDTEDCMFSNISREIYFLTNRAFQISVLSSYNAVPELHDERRKFSLSRRKCGVQLPSVSGRHPGGPNGI